MFWVTKYEPKNLKDLDYNPEITEKLYKLSKKQDFPHTIFCGPSGSGKRTRIQTLLREIYGPSVDNVKIDRREFKTRSAKKIELRTLQSNHHIEINPSDVSIHDEIVVQEIIKEIAQYRALNDPFKIVVITEADKLSHRAQHGLRATIEKYSASCKIIMCVESLSKIIDPILSRCFVMRIKTPKTAEICAVLDLISKKEKLKISKENILSIAEKSDYNLRRSILMLESFSGNNQISQFDWILYIEKIAKLIIKKQEPKTLIEVRNNLYELLSNCIPGTIIFRKLCFALISEIKDIKTQGEIVYWASFYEERSTKGQKNIYFLEPFIAKVLYILAEKSL